MILVWGSSMLLFYCDLVGVAWFTLSLMYCSCGGFRCFWSGCGGLVGGVDAHDRDFVCMFVSVSGVPVFVVVDGVYSALIDYYLPLIPLLLRLPLLIRNVCSLCC